MGARSKGDHYERRLVLNHTEAGFFCRRVPMSGSSAGLKGDLRIGSMRRVECADANINDENLLIGEVKARKAANGFKVVRDWLRPTQNHFLFLQEIGLPGVQVKHEPLVVMSFEMYSLMLKAFLEKQDRLALPQAFVHDHANNTEASHE
jgi:hypothetical protein